MILETPLTRALPELQYQICFCSRVILTLAMLHRFQSRLHFWAIAFTAGATVLTVLSDDYKTDNHVFSGVSHHVRTCLMTCFMAELLTLVVRAVPADSTLGPDPLRQVLRHRRQAHQ
jgi:hypothetical protein